MKSVYLDSSAFRELWTCGGFDQRQLQRLRIRLRSTLWHQRPVFVIGPQLISETLQLPSVPLIRERIEFLESIPGLQFVKAIDERIKEEVRARLAGTEPDVMLADDLRAIQLRLAYKSPPLREDELAHLSKVKMGFLSDEVKAKRDVLAEHAGNRSVLNANAKAWFLGNEELVVRKWAFALLQKYARRLGMPPKTREWPDVMSLPTVWGFSSFRAARIYLLYRDIRGIDENDAIDLQHYTAAMYADTLVTQDKRFREIVGHCPPPKPQVLGFREWAQKVLTGGSS